MWWCALRANERDRRWRAVSARVLLTRLPKCTRTCTHARARTCAVKLCVVSFSLAFARVDRRIVVRVHRCVRVCAARAVVRLRIDVIHHAVLVAAAAFVDGATCAARDVMACVVARFDLALSRDLCMSLCTPIVRDVLNGSLRAHTHTRVHALSSSLSLSSTRSRLSHAACITLRLRNGQTTRVLRTCARSCVPQTSRTSDTC
jgi:hypothetical protein